MTLLAFGTCAGSAWADHPGEAPELTPAVERVLGDETTHARSGLFRVPLDDGAVIRTHGPDLSPAAADPLAVAGPSDRFLPGSAERPPICAADYALQILYARNPASPDRFATVTPQLRSVVRRSNHVLNEEAIASGGGGGDYKVACTGGEIDVESFTTTATTYSGVVSSARAAGFTSSARDYVVFLDESASGYCGVGSLYLSDSPALSNPHNTNGGYSVIYEGCWDGTTFMHEVGHNRGAVQPAAPHSTGSGAHCNEGHDVMCYAPDGGDRNQSMVYPCSTMTRFDCNFDDYFDAAPEPGEYLANHWNVAAQGQNFLSILPDSSPDPEPDPDPEPEDAAAPETRITGVVTKAARKRSSFSFEGVDETSPASALAFECSLDQARFVPCTSPARYRLGRGPHSFSVRATDEAGNVDSTPATHSWRVRRNRN